MCRFCEKGDNLSEQGDLTIEMHGDIIHVEYDAFSRDSCFSDWININYCPMCGNSLKEKRIALRERYVQDTKNT